MGTIDQHNRGLEAERRAHEHQLRAERLRRGLGRARAWAGLVRGLGAVLARRRQRARAGVPRNHAARIRAPRETPAMRAARMLLDFEVPGERSLLVLLGTPDSGKSFALSWLCVQLGGRWVDGETLVDTWVRDRAALLRRRCVVVDDIARNAWTVAQSAAQAEVLDSLVKICCADGIVVALSGNLSRRGLEDFMCTSTTGRDESRWERMRERLWQHGVPVEGVPGEPPGVAVLSWLGLRRQR